MRFDLGSLMREFNDRYLETYPDRTISDICCYDHRKDETGICFELAKTLVRHAGGAIVVLVRTGPTGAEYPVHAVIRHTGRYYDSLNYEGVKLVDDLEWVRKHPTDHIGEHGWVEEINYAYHTPTGSCLELFKDALLESTTF